MTLVGQAAFQKSKIASVESRGGNLCLTDGDHKCDTHACKVPSAHAPSKIGADLLVTALRTDLAESGEEREKDQDKRRQILCQMWNQLQSQ